MDYTLKVYADETRMGTKFMFSGVYPDSKRTWIYNVLLRWHDMETYSDQLADFIEDNVFYEFERAMRRRLYHYKQVGP